MFQCALCESSSAGTSVARAYKNAPFCSWCYQEMQRTGRGYCPRCRASVPLDEMTTDMCKAHARARPRPHRQPERPQPMTERRRAIIKAAQARYVERNKARISLQDRLWKQRNRDRLNTQAKARRASHVAANPDYWKERRQRAKVNKWRRLFK